MVAWTATGQQVRRIQRRRTRDWKMPANAKYVGRPSRWGNPYTVKPIGMTEWIVVYRGNVVVSERVRSREVALQECLSRYRNWALSQIASDSLWLEPLRGKSLACWCREGDACHGDVLLSLIQELE